MKFHNCSEFPPNQEVIEFRADGKEWDLHNAAQFFAFSYQIPSQTAFLTWNYYDYDSGKVSHTIDFQLKNVYSLVIQERDREMPFTEDECLEEMVYNPNNESIKFLFRGGMSIAMRCTSLEAIIRKCEP